MRKTVLLGILGCALASCDGGAGSDSPPDGATRVGTPSGEVVSSAIGSEGGSLTSADGTFRVQIPPGALSGATDISVQPISNEAHGGVGSAYRIEAGGATLALPATLRFTYSDADVKGSTPEQLRVAFQREDRNWQLAGAAALDAEAKAVTLETTHFSDWSLIRGLVLKPSEATVKTGRSASFEVMSCVAPASDSPIAPLVVPCNVIGLLSETTWSVNDVVGGNATIGTVTGVARGRATYTAPSQVPTPDEVAVSIRYQGAGGSDEILVAPVRVVENADYVATFEVSLTSSEDAYTGRGHVELVQASIDDEGTTYSARSGSLKIDMPVKLGGETCTLSPDEAPVDDMRLVILKDEKRYYWTTSTVWPTTATLTDGLTVQVATGIQFTTLSENCMGMALQPIDSLDLLQGAATYTCGDAATYSGKWTFNRVP